MEKRNKIIGRRGFGSLQRLRRALVDNWCLKRSKVIYAVASRLFSGEVRINVAVRCREEVAQDWGHAWVTHNGKPLLEHEGSMLRRPMTQLTDTGKYIYWIYK